MNSIDLDYELLKASYRGNLEIVKYLVEKGADIEAKDMRGNTALNYANNTEILDYLTKVIEDRKINLNEDLLEASHNDDLKTVKYLIEKGVDIETKSTFGNTPLLRASFGCGLEIVKYLVEKGADIEAKTCSSGNTSLNIAAQEGRLEIVKYLVEKGADIEAKNEYGHTALDFANDEISDYLEQVIEDRKIKMNEDLLAASSKGYLYSVKQLIEKGADIEARDKREDDTSLILASLYGRLEVVKYLVEKGADIEAKDMRGNTALDFADNTEILDYLTKVIEDRKSTNNRSSISINITINGKSRLDMGCGFTAQGINNVIEELTLYRDEALTNEI